MRGSPVPLPPGHPLPLPVLAAAAAAVLAVAANWPGIRDALAGRFRPRPASWGPWTAALATGTGAAVADRAWPAAVYTGACAAGCGVILAAGWRRREPGWRRGDLCCAGLALAGTGLLAVSAARPALLPAVAAAGVAVAADLAAYLPTFRDGWSDPRHQPLGMYAMFAVSAGLTLAVERVPAGMVYPAYLAAADAAMCALICGRRAM